MTDHTMGHIMEYKEEVFLMNKRGFITICRVILFAALILVNSFLGCSIVQTNITDVSTIKPAIVLFNQDGSYAVDKYSIVKGAKFSFFGYEWRVVNIKDNIATFWMDSPFATSKFADSKESGVIQTADRIWNNGYFDATWKPTPTAQGQQLGISAIRQFLLDAENTVIGTKAGADKVVAGPLEGINQSNQTATITAYDIYYRQETLTNVKPTTDGQSIIIDYSIGFGDKLWLPSYQEIKDGGIWGLITADRNWDNTTVSQCAWLRTPFLGNNKYPANNCDALAVGYRPQTLNSKDFESVYFNYVDQQYGVRPAIHLNIQSASLGEIGN
jgi:hypothetical protein